MKRLLPFILIIVFISAQYGRIASYYHCLIVNVVEHDLPVSCDCEKVLTANPGAEKDGPSHILHIIQLSTDEYSILTLPENNFNCPEDRYQVNASYTNQYNFLYNKSIAIPPES